MFGINPETQRHYLADIERQMQPRSRSYSNEAHKSVLSKAVRDAPVALAAVLFLLGGLAGGTLL